MYEHIKICTFLFICFQNAMSYKIYQLDAAAGNNLIPKIRQLLLNQRNDEPDYESLKIQKNYEPEYESLKIQKNYEPEYQSVQVRKPKREPQRLKPMGKSVLVKRVIPHNYATGPYEYDSKLNTVFKPLTRVHVQKPIEDHERSLLKRMVSDQKRKDRLGKNLVILVPKVDNQQDLLNQIQKYINQNLRPQDSKQNVKENIITSILATIKEDSVTPLRQKSAEDPFAPGKLPSEMEESSSEEPDEKNSLPSYPFWNYWTYPKNILQDPCPANLVKVGNMCISSLGHRRSAYQPDTRRSHHHKNRHSMRASRKRHLYGRKK